MDGKISHSITKLMGGARMIIDRQKKNYFSTTGLYLGFAHNISFFFFLLSALSKKNDKWNGVPNEIQGKMIIKRDLVKINNFTYNNFCIIV